MKTLNCDRCRKKVPQGDLVEIVNSTEQADNVEAWLLECFMEVFEKFIHKFLCYECTEKLSLQAADLAVKKKKRDIMNKLTSVLVILLGLVIGTHLPSLHAGEERSVNERLDQLEADVKGIEIVANTDRSANIKRFRQLQARLDVLRNGVAVPKNAAPKKSVSKKQGNATLEERIQKLEDGQLTVRHATSKGFDAIHKALGLIKNEILNHGKALRIAAEGLDAAAKNDRTHLFALQAQKKAIDILVTHVIKLTGK